MKNILHIDASGRHEHSDSRRLSDHTVQALKQSGSDIIYRDVSQGLPFLNDTMIASYFTDPEQRDRLQQQAIADSDQVVQELQDSDAIVIGVPIYNFAMPAGLKAWADLAARAGVTFQYTDKGPVGLLNDKKAFVVITSGGVPIDSPVDFLTPWIRQFLAFIGIQDVTIIDAASLNQRGEEALQAAEAQIAQLTA